MRRLLLAIGLTFLAAGVAPAGVFKIPEEGATAISIEVPDSWNPNVSDDTIDTASPDRAVFFWLTVEKAADPTLDNRDVRQDDTAIVCGQRGNYWAIEEQETLLELEGKCDDVNQQSFA